MSVVLVAMQAHAGEIISAAGTVDVVNHVSNVAGDTVTYNDYANFSAKATTGYGVNKIYNQASTSSQQGVSYASSAWAETFTAQGTGMVTVKLNFTIDGSVNLGQNHMSTTNYLVTALTGAWNLTGTDEIVATKAAQSTEMVNGVSKNFSGQWNVDAYQPAGGTYNYYASTTDGYNLNRSINKAGDTFSIETHINTPTSTIQNLVTQTSDHLTLQQQKPDLSPLGPANVINYSAGTPAATAAQNAYLNNLNTFPILGQTGLCNSYSQALGYSGCAPGTYDPTTISLEFTLQAGTVFTIVSALGSSQLENGTVDFYNTVKLSDIEVTNGTLASDNSLFQSTGNGSYSFAAVTAPVPEPASWVLMIAGFGLVGGALRRKTAAVRFA